MRSRSSTSSAARDAASRSRTRSRWRRSRCCATWSLDRGGGGAAAARRGAFREVSFADVSYDEAMRRARECVPTLFERAQKCEDARVLLPENEKLLHAAGLFRFHQPKRFGGMELPFQAIVDIVAELARGCPSTAWNVGNLRWPHWILRYYAPQTQYEGW